MKKVGIILFLMLFVLVACSESNETDADTKGESGQAIEEAFTLFEAGTYRAERQIFMLPEDKRDEIEQIALTMQLALVQHQAWYEEELSKLKDGEPLPYDARLGVSQEEYSTLIAEDNDLVLTKIGETDVTITQAKKQLKIDFAGQTILKNIAIANKGKTIMTDIGDLTYVEAVQAAADQSIGRWNGHLYRLGAEGDAQTLQISIGAFEEDSKKFIHVEAFSEGRDKLEEYIVF